MSAAIEDVPRGTEGGRSLGLATCTALVIGNMVGSGFFIAPSALAPYGTTAIIGWGVMAVGAVSLGLVFARLARIAPATGGPYAYTRMGYGRFAGFFIAWGYWISIWASLPAMAAALVGYLGALVPGLGQHRPLCVGIGLGAMWLVTIINLRGVKEAGLFQSVTTYTKLVPFVAISVFGLFWVDWKTFETLNPSDQPFLGALAATAPLTMFAFLGIESATVPAGDVIDPRRTIPRATVLGTVIAALVYILGTVVVLGVIPREKLVRSSSPFADVASAMWGEWAGIVIALAAIISSLGALNGWTLMLGQIPMAAAADGAMPAVFGQLSARGVPARGLVISVGLATLLVLLEVSGTSAMVAFYNLIVQLSTDAAMIPYVFCSVVEAVLFVSRRPISRALRVGPFMPISLVAFVFSLGTIYGSGASAGMWALILLLFAAPIWVFLVGTGPPDRSAPSKPGDQA
ncbi:MAG TPA: amino acid permease [Myxococcota bacterium]|nr:amino acid permease [Myxococcota bacterium]